MPVTILVVGALVLGAAPATAAIAGAAGISLPIAAALGVAAGVARRARLWERAPAPVDEARFCAALSAELHAGASLREAVSAAAGAEGDARMRRLQRAATGGEPAHEIAAALGDALPASGRHAGFAFEVASETGAGAAAVFDRLADHASRHTELRREERTLTAQARLSAYVVGGAPAVVVILLAVTGRMSSLTGSAAGATVAAIGLGLISAGLGVVWLMMRAAR